MELKPIKSNKRGLQCIFCSLSKIDEVKYGPLYKIEDIVVHYYCVLLSHRMQQNGEDDDGILGFLLPDIRAELRRVSSIVCTYCQLPGASIVCGTGKCKIKFHLPCGLKRSSLHQFSDKFLSFCSTHRPRQDVSNRALLAAEEGNVICCICYSDLDFRDEIDTLWAPCCELSWYHRVCVQKMALNAGYFFKCAVCSNQDKFRSWMLKYGIFIPERDASWELEQNAFEDLLQRHDNCDAVKCKCPRGRKYDTDDGPWAIVLCRTCGSQGIHIKCGNLKFSNTQWECPLCSTLERDNNSSDVPGQFIMQEPDVASSSSVNNTSFSERSEELQKRWENFEEKRKQFSTLALKRTSGSLKLSPDGTKGTNNSSDNKYKSRRCYVKGTVREQAWCTNALLMDAVISLSDGRNVCLGSSFQKTKMIHLPVEPRKGSSAHGANTRRESATQQSPDSKTLASASSNSSSDTDSETLAQQARTLWMTMKTEREGSEDSSQHNRRKRKRHRKEEENQEGGGVMEIEEQDRIGEDAAVPAASVPRIKPGPLWFKWRQFKDKVPESKLVQLLDLMKGPSVLPGSDDDSQESDEILELPYEKKIHQVDVVQLSDSDEPTTTDTKSCNIGYLVKKQKLDFDDCVNLEDSADEKSNTATETKQVEKVSFLEELESKKCQIMDESRAERFLVVKVEPEEVETKKTSENPLTKKLPTRVSKKVHRRSATKGGVEDSGSSSQLKERAVGKVQPQRQELSSADNVNREQSLLRVLLNNNEPARQESIVRLNGDYFRMISTDGSDGSAYSLVKLSEPGVIQTLQVVTPLETSLQVVTPLETSLQVVPLPESSLQVVPLPESSLEIVPLPETSLQLQPDSMPSRTLQPDSIPSRTLEPDSIPSRTLQPASMPSRTLQPDSIPSRTLQPASMPSHTLQPDSMPSRPLQPASMPSRTLQPDSMPSRTLQPDSMPSRTLQPDSMPSRTLQPDSMPSRTLQPDSMPSRTLQPASMPSRTLQPASMPSHALQPTPLSVQAQTPPQISHIGTSAPRLNIPSEFSFQSQRLATRPVRTPPPPYHFPSTSNISATSSSCISTSTLMAPHQAHQPPAYRVPSQTIPQRSNDVIINITTPEFRQGEAHTATAGVAPRPTGATSAISATPVTSASNLTLSKLLSTPLGSMSNIPNTPFPAQPLSMFEVLGSLDPVVTGMSSTADVRISYSSKPVAPSSSSPLHGSAWEDAVDPLQGTEDADWTSKLDCRIADPVASEPDAQADAEAHDISILLEHLSVPAVASGKRASQSAIQSPGPATWPSPPSKIPAAAKSKRASQSAIQSPGPTTWQYPPSKLPAAASRRRASQSAKPASGVPSFSSVPGKVPAATNSKPAILSARRRTWQTPPAAIATPASPSAQKAHLPSSVALLKSSAGAGPSHRQARNSSNKIEQVPQAATNAGPKPAARQSATVPEKSVVPSKRSRKPMLIVLDMEPDIVLLD